MFVNLGVSVLESRCRFDHFQGLFRLSACYRSSLISIPSPSCSLPPPLFVCSFLFSSFPPSFPISPSLLPAFSPSCRSPPCCRCRRPVVTGYLTQVRACFLSDNLSENWEKPPLERERKLWLCIWSWPKKERDYERDVERKKEKDKEKGKNEKTRKEGRNERNNKIKMK